MHLDHDKTPLPTSLRDSNLPWTADQDDQAAAFADGDSWTCHLGHLRFDLDVYWDSVYREEGSVYRGDGSGSRPPEFNLRLQNTATDKELGFWEFPRLDTAVAVAQTLHQERLDQLLSSVRKDLHDVAA